MVIREVTGMHLITALTRDWKVNFYIVMILPADVVIGVVSAMMSVSMHIFNDDGCYRGKRTRAVAHRPAASLMIIDAGAIGSAKICFCGDHDDLCRRRFSLSIIGDAAFHVFPPRIALMPPWLQQLLMTAVPHLG